MRGGKPQRRPLRVSQDSALEFYGRSTVDLAHKLAAQESTQSPLDVEGRESCRILHEEETDRLRDCLKAAPAGAHQVFSLEQYNAVQTAVLAAHARRGTAPEASHLYVIVSTLYLWGLLPGVLLFSLSTLFFTTLARLLQPSGRSAAAPKSDVPSVNMCKVQEHVERIQQSHKVVCSGLASG